MSLEVLFEVLLLSDMLVQFPVSKIYIQYDERYKKSDENNKNQDNRSKCFSYHFSNTELTKINKYLDSLQLAIIAS